MALDYGYNEKPDIETTWGLVISINNYIHEFTTSFHRWENLKRRCTASRLVVQKQGFFEFSDQSILSNLYWGVDNIESAIQSKWCEERTSKLRNSERMLQAPALLDEVEITGGVPNRFLVCCSYFYLAVVRNLLGDDLQVALHFLQAVLVFPRLVAEEFAPELCVKLFPSLKFQEMGRRKTGSFRFREDDFDESMRRLARRYKHWLMYYQVLQSGNQTVSTHDVESQRFK